MQMRCARSQLWTSPMSRSQDRWGSESVLDHSLVAMSLKKNGASPGKAAARMTLVRRMRSKVHSYSSCRACAGRGEDEATEAGGECTARGHGWFLRWKA